MFFVGRHFTGMASCCRSAERNKKRNLGEELASFSATSKESETISSFEACGPMSENVSKSEKRRSFGAGFSQHCLYRSVSCRCLVSSSVLHYSFVRAPLVQKTPMASAKPSWLSHLPRKAAQRQVNTKENMALESKVSIAH